MRKLGAEIIRVKGNYEKSLEECINQSNKNRWEIVQDVAWENYENVPKLTMAGYSVMIKEISNQTDQYITHIFLKMLIVYFKVLIKVLYRKLILKKRVLWEECHVGRYH